MPIDPSVLLYGLQPQARTPYDAPDLVAERRARVEQLREAAKAKQDAEYENQVYDWAVKSNLGPDGTPDFEGVRKSLAATAPRFLQKFDAAMNTAKKSQAETDKLEDDHREKMTSWAGSAFNNADDTNYGDIFPVVQRGAPQLVKQYGLTGDFQHDQGAIGAIRSAATSMPDQLKAAEEARGHAMKNDYLSGIAKIFEADPNLTDDTIARVAGDFRHKYGMGVTDYQTVMNLDTAKAKEWAANLLHPTTPHEKETEDISKAQLNQGAIAQAEKTAVDAANAKRADTAAANLENFRKASLAIQQMNATTTRMREQQTQTKDATTQSYNASKTRLDALRKPVEDTLNKVTELSDLVEQRNPQADALIPPKLIAVMVGGMGTGVRVTQGEIERVVGGRTNFEALQAQLNKWRLDPSKGLSLTEPQRQQIRDIVSTISDKATSKIGRIQKADADLLDAPDTRGQRQVIVDLQKDVEDLAGGAAAGKGGGGATTKMLRVGQNAPFQVTKQPDGTWKSASGGIYDDSGTRLR